MMVSQPGSHRQNLIGFNIPTFICDQTDSDIAVLFHEHSSDRQYPDIGSTKHTYSLLER